jgi:hypothetical protein
MVRQKWHGRNGKVEMARQKWQGKNGTLKFFIKYNKMFKKSITHTKRQTN